MRSTVRVRLSATDVPFLGLNSYLLFTANKGVREAFDKLMPTQLLLRRRHAARLTSVRAQMHRLQQLSVEPARNAGRSPSPGRAGNWELVGWIHTGHPKD